MKKAIKAIIVGLANAVAQSAAGAASNWGTYQPMEPKKLHRKQQK